MIQTNALQDTQWMRAALTQARAADAAGEVPVGAVVVLHGEVIATGYNAPIAKHDPSAHAEMVALRAAAQHLGNYRLDDCELYVTLEPCTMCAGAMLHARLKRVVFGAADPKTGAAGSVHDVFALQQLNHHTQVQGGVMEEDCAGLLLNFFGRQRSLLQLDKVKSGRALRQDAVRTPEVRFANLPNMPEPSCYVSDLPSLNGLRLHYVDAGSPDAVDIVLCLHGLSDWSYAWRHLVENAGARGQRVICPDLIGFGKSDKPKKTTLHTLAWHTQILRELLDRLDVRNVTLLVSDTSSVLAQHLEADTPGRIQKIVESQPSAMNFEALEAPFPDAGHRAALRAFSAVTIAPIGTRTESNFE